MSGLSVAGIASGIDSDSIISQMVAFETRSTATFQRRIAVEEAERTLFQDISSRMQDLKGATGAFASSSLFSSLSATSSLPDLLSVSATSKAPRGTQSVRVLQLATAHRVGGTGVEDATATPLLQGFTKTTYGALTKLSALGSDAKVSSTALNYDYADKAHVQGTYTGTENLDIVVQVAADAVFSAGNESVSLKVSTDGGKTFGAAASYTAVGGKVTLNSAALGNLGMSLELASLQNGGSGDVTLKKNDQLSFRVRGQASIEYTVGDGERKELLIGSAMTLSELVRDINEDTTLGLRADILNDGSSTNPFRLILTSLTEGRAGSISVLHNDSVINLKGVTAETPVLDSGSYGGAVTVSGTYTGSGNKALVLEVMTAGAVGAAKFRISTDGGLTFNDNAGAGFSLTSTVDLGALSSVLGGDPGIDLNFTAGSFAVGDRVTVDLFDSQIQVAQDALINVNGINLVKSSNVVNDVFEGLTLTLKNADPAKTINVGVTEKTGDITAALGKFVDSYNSIMSVLYAQSKYNPEEDKNAPLLMGDATVRQMQSSLQRYVTGRIGILGSDTLSSLADLGVTTDSKTGQLSFNTAKLATALNKDATGVRRLLSRFGDLVEGSNASFVSSTAATKAGTYAVKVTQARTRAEVIGTTAVATLASPESLTIRVNKDANGTGNVTSMVVNLAAGLSASAQVTAIQDVLDTKNVNVTASIESGKLVLRHNEYGSTFKIDVTSSLIAGNTGFTTTQVADQGTDLKGTLNGVEATASGDELIGKVGFAFDGLRVRVDNDFVGTAGTIRLNDGLGSSFTKLLDSFVSTEGVLSTRIKSFDATISRVQAQITRVSERASLLETRLRKQFSTLEVTLGRLNATGQYLTAQLKALPGVQRD
ncbi:MAG: hypothetical protein FJ138_03515 [Deltaproteobacteria bacterium]|nr:hypothetical protein [Deltaproteobacteria bacterium]